MDNFLRVALMLAVMGLSFAAVWLGSIDKSDAASIAAALAFGLCIFVFLYRFKRFKGLGFEGELWEQEMEKASEIRRSLRDLAEQASENIYWDLGPGSRVGGKSPNELFSIVKRTDQNLESIGIERQKIDELKRPWHKCVMRDLAYPIVERIGVAAQNRRKNIEAEMEAIGNPVPAEKLPEFEALARERPKIAEVVKELDKLIWRDDYETVPNRLRNAIKGSDWLVADEQQEILLDMAEEFNDIDGYAANRTIRRPQQLGL
ncbi:MAG: hypothetical protein HOB72_08920 [Rhodospirillaceae bacterium]|nr:hypothetical protein [Rhodospirillaceae bacterium]